MWVLWAYCILDELVGLSVDRAAVTRVLYMRRNLLYSFFLGKIEFSKRKKWPFHHVRAVDYWTVKAVQQCFSVLVRCYDVLKLEKIYR